MRFLSALLLTTATWSGFIHCTNAIKIMPLGDSITQGGCWRAMLWQKLENTGYTGLDFVGSMQSNATACNINYDPDNEGHSGFLATNIADQNLLVPWLASANPNIVLIHLGTNDIWHKKLKAPAILAAFTKLVGQIRANNSRMKIIVAKIIPIHRSSCDTCPPLVLSLNAAIPRWAAQLSTRTSPITTVDQWTGFDAASDTGDGLHPNASGDKKMANRWYPAVVVALGKPTGGTLAGFLSRLLGGIH